MQSDNNAQATNDTFRVEPTPEAIARDWPEDFGHENGRYWCKCIECGNAFMGHKRRVVCKTCAQTKDTQATIADFLRAIAENPQAFTDEGKRRHLLDAAHAIESYQGNVTLLEADIERLREGFEKLWKRWNQCETHSSHDRRLMEGAFREIMVSTPTRE